MRKFSYEANGYKKSEVIEFVDYVIEETKRLVLIINKQEDEYNLIFNAAYTDNQARIVFNIGDAGKTAVVSYVKNQSSDKTIRRLCGSQ